MPFLEVRHEEKATHDYRRHCRGVVFDRFGIAAFYQRKPIQADAANRPGWRAGTSRGNRGYQPLNHLRWRDGFGGFHWRRSGVQSVAILDGEVCECRRRDAAADFLEETRGAFADGEGSGSESDPRGEWDVELFELGREFEHREARAEKFDDSSFWRGRRCGLVERWENQHRKWKDHRERCGIQRQTE